MARAAFLGLWLAAAMGICPGCGSQEAVLVNDLKQVGVGYHNFHDANRQGPAGWDEFMEFARGTNEPVEAYERVRAAGYELKWGVKFQDVTEGLGNSVLAQRPGGGPTLMMDGSVRQD